MAALAFKLLQRAEPCVISQGACGALMVSCCNPPHLIRPARKALSPALTTSPVAVASGSKALPGAQLPHSYTSTNISREAVALQAHHQDMSLRREHNRVRLHSHRHLWLGPTSDSSTAIAVGVYGSGVCLCATLASTGRLQAMCTGSTRCSDGRLCTSSSMASLSLRPPMWCFKGPTLLRCVSARAHTHTHRGGELQTYCCWLAVVWDTSGGHMRPLASSAVATRMRQVFCNSTSSFEPAEGTCREFVAQQSMQQVPQGTNNMTS